MISGPEHGLLEIETRIMMKMYYYSNNHGCLLDTCCVQDVLLIRLYPGPAMCLVRAVPGTGDKLSLCLHESDILEERINMNT